MSKEIMSVEGGYTTLYNYGLLLLLSADFMAGILGE
jgi:hypothetical protein